MCVVAESFTLPMVAYSQCAMDTVLNWPTVHMRDASVVDSKLSRIIAGGCDRLLVISDFDYTLSRFHDRAGRKRWTTHDVFEGAGSLCNFNFGTIFSRLKAKYLPIEFDPDMTVAEKTPHMEKWWQTAHDHIIRKKLTRNALEVCVRHSEIELRQEADVFVSTLRSQHVPLIVFSAGVGNVIEIYLRNLFGKMPENVHIISNMMNFDENGVVKSFSEPLIHTFCKNSSVIRQEHTFFNDLSDRTNVILMGDSLGDANMDVGIGGDGISLKIGFLNFNVDMLLEKYLNTYDIVLVDDQTMKIPLKVISAVCGLPSNDSIYITVPDSAVAYCCQEVEEKTVTVPPPPSSEPKKKVGEEPVSFDVKA